MKAHIGVKAATHGMLTIAVVASLMGAFAANAQEPQTQRYNDVAARNVATLPNGVEAAASASIIKRPRNVIGGLELGQRDVYEWTSPENLRSAVWDGGWASTKLYPGRIHYGADSSNSYRGDAIPQGYRGNLALLPAWVPPSLFPRAATLGESSEALIPAGMYTSPTGWQGREREVLQGRVDLMTGTPLIQVTDLELPVAGATFQLTRTRSAMHGSTFPAIGSEGQHKFEFDATDRVWDWLGSGWMVGENPILLIDDTRADTVGDNPPTCWLILDAHRSIPFQWIPDIQRYEAPPRFRASLTYTQVQDTEGEGSTTSGKARSGSLGVGESGDVIWEAPPKELKVSLYDGALVYTFAVIWEDVPTNTWRRSYLDPSREDWATSSLHDRPFLPEHFGGTGGVTGDPRADHDPFDRTINRGLGVPYYALLTQIEDRNGVRVEINYARFEQRSMDSSLSSVHEVIQDGHKKGQISHIRVFAPGDDNPKWTLVYSHRTFVGIRRPIGINNEYSISRELGPDDEVLSDWFFDHGARREYPWDVDSDGSRDRGAIHGYSAIDRIYVYKGDNQLEGYLDQVHLQSSPWTPELIEESDSVSALNAPLVRECERLNISSTSHALLNWTYAIRYDYNRRVEESFPEPNPDTYRHMEGWWPWLSYDDPFFSPAVEPAQAPTSPPLLLLTTVFERTTSQEPPTPIKRRGLMYAVDPRLPVNQANENPYVPQYTGAGGGDGGPGGSFALPWIEAILEQTDIARLAKIELPSDIQLSDILLNCHVTANGRETLPESVREAALQCASIRLGQAPSEINDSGEGTDAAPSMSALWTSPAAPDVPGPYIRTGSGAGDGDSQAYWDGHWATVGELSSYSDTSSAQFHARIHRFIRRPIDVGDRDNPHTRSRFALPGYAHAIDGPPMASVFLSPFQWHAYGRVDSGESTSFPALVSPPDGSTLAEPRVIVVVDEFESRELMVARGDPSLPEDGHSRYTRAQDGAIKSGMVARTVYELNPWGYVLRKRRWDFTKDGFNVQTDGIGEEYIYKSIGQIVSEAGQSLPTAEHLAPPSGFVDELVLSEHRSLGWSVADQQSTGATEGLIEFYEYAVAITSDEDALQSFGWTDRVQLRAEGVRNGADSPKYYTRQYFYDHPLVPNIPTAVVRFNTPTTSRRESAPPLVYGSSYAHNPEISVEHLVDQYPNPTVTHADVPSMRTRISPPLQQRPGGDWYFPIQIECRDSRGQLEWLGAGLVRNPLNPSAGPSDPLETLTWTYHQAGEHGRPRAIVVDVAPPLSGQGNGIYLPYEQPELGPNQTITVATFVQRWTGSQNVYDLPPRIAGPYDTGPRARLTVYGYDRDGQLTDVIEPDRRWARRVVTDLGPPGPQGVENTNPLDDVTYEYTFSGLTHASYQASAEGSTDGGTYECSDGGTIAIHNGRQIAGAADSTTHVKFNQRVPIRLTAANRPQSVEELRRTTFTLDDTGRPQQAETLVPINGVMLPQGGRSINDLGEIYRVREFAGNVNRWTRNYLGQRLRRYEGTLDTYWGTEEYATSANGITSHPLADEHGLGEQLTGYDMVLKELFRFGDSPKNVRQPVEHLRFLNDSRHSWAHVRNGDSGGYHNPPSAAHLADAEDDAYLAAYQYDWSMRRVREDLYEIPPVGDTRQNSDRQRTILHYYDYAGREAMTVVYGPIMPNDISLIDPTTIGPDAALPSVESILSKSPRPLSITTRTFDNADRPVETREYDVASLADHPAYTRSFAYHGFKDNVCFTLQSGAPAAATYLDALGRPTATVELATDHTGQWTVELTREDRTLNDRGQVLIQTTWERVRSDGLSLNLSNAVPTTVWNWYDHSGRLTAMAELGTSPGAASYVAPESLPTGYNAASGPRFVGSTLSVDLGGVPSSARVTVHSYDDAGRLIATRYPDGTVTSFTFEGARPLATTHNATAAPGEPTRTHSQMLRDGRVASMQTVADINANPAPAHGTMSQRFGAPVVDRNFAIQSFDRTLPSRMGRVVDPVATDAGDPAPQPQYEFEFAYDFVGRLAQRSALDGTVTRYTYDLFDEIRTIEIGHFVNGAFTPGYPASSGIAAADRIGFVEFTSSWSIGEHAEPIETRDIIARVARSAPGGGPGRIVSHVQQHFDARGQLVRELQSIGTEVNENTPAVEYVWQFVPASSVSDTGYSRLSAIRYPDFFSSGRRTVTFSYGEPGSLTDQLKLAAIMSSSVDGGPASDLLKCTYQSTCRRSSESISRMSLDPHSDAGSPLVGFDRLDPFGDLAIVSYQSLGAYGQSTPLYTALYRRDALARITSINTSYAAAFNNTRSTGLRYDGLGRLSYSSIGSISFTPGDPTSWSMSSVYRSDAWHLDHLDNWNRADPNNSALFGHVTVGNLDTDPATETAFFHYDTTASGDLDLLTHGLDGTVDPPVQIQRDPLGRVTFDGIYFYGYDAWGRLTQINLAEPDTNGDPQQGELVRHFVYDGLGRTIRVQRAADSGFINDPEASYVSSEFIFYDGMRRIADVVAAPVYDKYSALVTGGESGENQ